jgi:hypothetical protein
MNMIFRILAVMAMLCAPAHAQFANQANYAGASAGTNTITIPLANWVRNLVGVPVRFLPANSNTGAATANVNSVGAANILKPNNGGLTALTGGEIRASQMATIVFDGTQWVLQDQLGTFTEASTLASSALQSGMPYNMALSASVSANALTVSMLTAAGGTPSAASPVIIPFRNSTIANGIQQNVLVTGALTFTIASSATMGCTSAAMCRLWIVAICSSGLSCTGSPGTDTVGLCAINVRSGTNILSINEASLQTSASGTSGGSSAQTYYCNISSVTSRAVRIVGYVDIQEVTAGTWATAPTTVQVFGPGVKRPGEIVSSWSSTITAGTTINSSAPTLSSITISVTLSSAANITRLRANTVYRNVGATGLALGQLGRSGPTLFGNLTYINVSSTNIATWTGSDFPNTLSAITYGVYAWQTSGNNILFCDGGSIVCTNEISVDEIMSSLEPSNDNFFIEDRATA